MKSSNALVMLCVLLPAPALAQSTAEEAILAFVNDPTAILVSNKLATARGLRAEPISSEDDQPPLPEWCKSEAACTSVLPLMTSTGPVDFHVKGLLKDEGPAASFGGQVVVMFIDAAQVSFSRGYSVDRIDIVVVRTSDRGQLAPREHLAAR